MTTALHAQDRGSTIAVVGEFSNMRYTEEHAYGYTIQLWRDGSSVFGLFLASEGLAGDTPTGVLDNVKFDAATGKLSFQTKLTIGAFIVAGGKQQSSRDLFEFDGKLSRSELTGVLKHSDRLQIPPAVQTARVKLKRQGATSIASPKSYQEWKTQTSEILRLRGPKW